MSNLDEMIARATAARENAHAPYSGFKVGACLKADDGRLFTGDLGRLDEEGYLYIVSRKKEIIKVGGNRVSALEIEQTILEHEGVAAAAVVGMPDEVLGEAVKAVVVPRSHVALEPDTIRDFCRCRLALHKVPQIVEFMSALPTHQSGKVDKKALR